MYYTNINIYNTWLAIYKCRHFHPNIPVFNGKYLHLIDTILKI